jgi:hypothetical protein
LSGCTGHEYVNFKRKRGLEALIQFGNFCRCPLA